MIVVRDIFRLEFGRSKEAIAHWREALAALRDSGYGAVSARLLTDLVGGEYYTTVLESTYNSLADWEKATWQRATTRIGRRSTPRSSP
jgi:hypothetical protein